MTARLAEQRSASLSPSLAHSARILLIEDDDRQRETLTTMLRARGHQVEPASTGREGLRHAASLRPDLVLLDLGLPDIDGADLCRRLRLELSCPIVVVTADAVEDRIVELLGLGADDFIAKPYGARELLARVDVALRHRLATVSLLDEGVLRCGDVIVDIDAHIVLVAGESIEVMPRQFDLLVALVRNEGRVMTYGTLARVVWGLHAADDYRIALRSAVSKLRRALGRGPRRPVIRTEQHVGYRLVDPLTD